MIVVALWTLASGHPRAPPGGSGWEGESENGASLPRRRTPPPRCSPVGPGVLAAFVALLVHTMAYAGFFEDPITWVLLAVGASLAACSPGSATPLRLLPCRDTCADTLADDRNPAYTAARHP